MDRRLWTRVATLAASVLLVIVSGVLYVNHAVTEEDKRVNHAIAVEDAKVRQAIAAEGRIQCVIYTQLDAAYTKTPPATPAGKLFAAAIHKVVLDLGC